MKRERAAWTMSVRAAPRDTRISDKDQGRPLNQLLTFVEATSRTVTAYGRYVCSVPCIWLICDRSSPLNLDHAFLLAPEIRVSATTSLRFLTVLLQYGI